MKSVELWRTAVLSIALAACNQGPADSTPNHDTNLSMPTPVVQLEPQLMDVNNLTSQEGLMNMARNSLTYAVLTGQTMNQFVNECEKLIGQCDTKGTPFETITITNIELPENNSSYTYWGYPIRGAQGGISLSIEVAISPQSLETQGFVIGERDARDSIVVAIVNKATSEHERMHLRHILNNWLQIAKSNGDMTKKASFDDKTKTDIDTFLETYSRDVATKVEGVTPFEILPYMITYLDMQEELRKHGYDLVMGEVTNGAIQNEDMPIIVKDGKPWLIINRSGYVAVGRIMRRYGIDRSWLEKNAQIPTTDWNPAILSLFSQSFAQPPMYP